MQGHLRSMETFRDGAQFEIAPSSLLVLNRVTEINRDYLSTTPMINQGY